MLKGQGVHLLQCMVPTKNKVTVEHYKPFTEHTNEFLHKGLDWGDLLYSLTIKIQPNPLPIFVLFEILRPSQQLWS